MVSAAALLALLAAWPCFGQSSIVDVTGREIRPPARVDTLLAEPGVLPR